MEFFVASPVSLARAADAEVDVCTNVDNAAAPSDVQTAAQPPNASACGVSLSAWEEVVARGSLAVAAVVDVVMQERAAGRPATLADAQKFLRGKGLVFRTDNKVFKDAGAVLAVITARSKADHERRDAAANLLRTADEQNRHLASELRALREATAGDKAETRSRLAALMEAQAQVAAALQRSLLEDGA